MPVRAKIGERPTGAGGGLGGGLPRLGGGGGATRVSVGSTYGSSAPPTSSGSGSGGSAPPIPAAPPAASTNIAAANPAMSGILNQTQELTKMPVKEDSLLEEQVGNLRERISSNPTQRAVGLMTGTVGDALAGAQQGLKENLARRGLLGSGIEAQGMQGLQESAQRDIARGSAGIGLQREQDIDRLVLGGQGIMGAPGQFGLQQQSMRNQLLGQAGNLAGNIAQQQLGQQSLANQQWQAQLQAQLAQQQMAQQQAMQQQQAMLSLYNTLWR